jgi:hypothetical protein
MSVRGRPRKETAEADNARGTKVLSLKREIIRAFDILKAEPGARSGPRLAAEAIDLLLQKYGKQPVGFP